MRLLLSGSAFVLSVALATPASSTEFPSEAWQHDGVAIAALAGDQSSPRILSDGIDGMLVTWRDAGTGRISIQRVLPNGAIAPGWLAGGRFAHPIAVSPAAYSIARDDAGGAFVVAVDSRDGTARAYGYHILGDGTDDPLWSATGLLIGGVGSTSDPRAFRDGSGGLIVCFDLNQPPSSREVRVTRRTSGGDPAASWPPDGMIVASTTSSFHTVDDAQAVEDGEGGLYMAQGETFYPTCQYPQHGCPENPTYMRRFLMVRNGVIEWNVLPNGAHMEALIQTDGQNGVIATGIYSGQLGGNWQRRLPHSEVAWSVSTPLPYYNPWFSVVGDGTGGVLVRHLPAGYGDTSHFFRLNASGALAPGWPSPNGVESARATGPMIADGTGGGYVAWEYDSPGTGTDLFAARFSGAGEFSPTGTSTGTLLVGAPGTQSEEQLLSDGDEGFYLVWTDERGGDKDVYAQRFGFDAPVPVDLAFVEAMVDEGAVRLSWYAADAASEAFRLERADARAVPTEWAAVAAELAVQGSLLRWTDRTVVAGEAYSYRMSWSDERGPRHSEAVTVAVPTADGAGVTALLGPSRQPMRAGDRLRFRIAAQDKGAIEIFDVLGHRRARIDLIDRAAGEHDITLDRGTGLVPGVYWARLAHGSTTQKLKFVYVD
jgi:hypothetical protein